MTELFHSEVELIVLERLLDDGDWAVGEDAAEHFAIRVTGDDHDGKVWVNQLQLAVDFVTGDVGKFEVEEDEVELLFLGDGDGLSAGADDQASETCFFEELFEESLEGGIVIDDENSRLTTFILFAKDVTIEEAALDAPAATDLDGRKLAALNEIIDGWERDPEVLGSFLNGHQFRLGFVSHSVLGCGRFRELVWLFRR